MPKFFFEASGCLPHVLADAIAEHYGVSVLVSGGPGEDKLLHGRVVAESCEQAVQALAFLMGVKYRREGSIYFVGGRTEKTVKSFPSYGLKASELGGVVKDGGSLVGDRIIVETDEMRSAQIEDALKLYGQRPALTLEVYVLAMADTEVDRVNAWLSVFEAGAGYFVNSAVPYVNPYGSAAGAAAGLVNGDSARARGLQYRVDAGALFQLLSANTQIAVELREQIQVLSGSRSKFESGQVLTDTTYTTLPAGTSSSQQLVSSITRRTVGLQLDLAASCSGSNWYVTLDVKDSVVAGSGNSPDERTTTYTGDRIVRPQDTWFLLASFQRRSLVAHLDKVPVLGDLPLLKAVFRRGEDAREKRSVMILARPVGVVDVSTPAPGGMMSRLPVFPPDFGPNTAIRKTGTSSALAAPRWAPVPGPSLK